MTHTGFEWLFRMIQEPKRLCRRYLARDPKAFRLILGQRLRGISTEWPPEQA
jgi:UDP-N-acetyl-D-mannosaminuronic acid transferase (WecB/TagA/CpsF family)